MMIAGIADAETGGNIANLLFSLSLIFCGILQSPQALPGFWIFMYRVSPFTYMVEGMLSIGIANQVVQCASNEYVAFSPPQGSTCAQYMEPYISRGGGYLQNPMATDSCEFCSYNSTNVFLEGLDVHYANVWRNFGILLVYIVFNIFAAVGIYWLARVPKNAGKKKKEEKTIA